MGYRKSVRICGRVSCVPAILALSGCMTVATLPDGQPSLMNQPSFQERSQFVISAVPSSRRGCLGRRCEGCTLWRRPGEGRDP